MLFQLVVHNDELRKPNRVFFSYCHQPDDTNEAHVKTFKASSDVVEYYDGAVYVNEALINYEKEMHKK